MPHEMDSAAPQNKKVGSGVHLIMKWSVNYSMFTKCRMLAVITILLALCGCAVNTGTQYSDIHLCDYKTIAITEDMFLVSEADLNTAMTMYAISTDAELEDFTELTDEIVQHYFGVEGVIELREQALQDIVSHRIIDAVYAQILLNSHMDFNSNNLHFKRYYSNRISSIEYLAKQADMTVSEFLEQNYQMTEAEFKDSEIDFYVTVCIINEIFDAENHPDLQSDIDDYRSALAQQAGWPVEETYKIVLDEDLFYLIAESKMYELIAEWYAADICDAYTLARQSLTSF